MFATQDLDPLLLETMNSNRSNCLRLKYQRFPIQPYGCKDIGISKFDFVARTQFFEDTHFFVCLLNCTIQVLREL